MASPSAWTAKAHGVTMSLSSGFGGRSNTRRYISEPTTRCPSPGLPSADTSASTTAEDHIRALTGRRPIRPTTPRCRMTGRRSTYQTEEAVQTSGASSVHGNNFAPLTVVHGVAVPEVLEVTFVSSEHYVPENT